MENKYKIELSKEDINELVHALSVSAIEGQSDEQVCERLEAYLKDATMTPLQKALL